MFCDIFYSLLLFLLSETAVNKLIGLFKITIQMSTASCIFYLKYPQFLSHVLKVVRLHILSAHKMVLTILHLSLHLILLMNMKLVLLAQQSIYSVGV